MNEPVTNQTNGPGNSQILHIQGFTYADRTTLLPVLSAAILRSGGWVLRRCPLSSNSIQLQIELQARAMLDVYAGLLGCGLELTRAGHIALAEGCNCHQQMPPQPGRLTSIHLAVAFLDELQGDHLRTRPNA